MVLNNLNFDKEGELLILYHQLIFELNSKIWLLLNIFKPSENFENYLASLNTFQFQPSELRFYLALLKYLGKTLS